MPVLLVREGRRSGERLSVKKPRVTIGRAAGNDLRFDDRTVSRYHALLSERDGEWYINDLGSRNRTMVNGACIVAARLCHMDEVHIGNVVLAFLEQGEETTETRTTSPPLHSAEVTQTIRLDRLQELTGARRRTWSRDARRDHHLGRLMSLAELAAYARDLESLCDGVVDALQYALDAERVVPILEEPAGTFRPYVAARRSFGEGLEDHDLDAALVERSCREGAIGASRAGGDLHVACSPIRLGRRNLGLIYCVTSRPSAPFDEDDLRYLFSVCVAVGMAIDGIRATHRIATREENLRRQLRQRYDMVGESDALKAVHHFIRRVAPTDAGVLICGESGTGKELVARAIHRHSLRCDGPLETMSAAAMPPTLVESELFGHAKGAFTGAVADKPGRFELADGGTLFLDEVGELPAECQTKLLRVLEEGKIRRLGDTRDREVDVRLIAATNRDPKEAVAQRLMREDLFYRLDRLRIVVPPLRDRADDVELLAQHFLSVFSRQCKRPISGYAPEVMDVFKAYHWPGNVRELQNVVERMVILGDSSVLGLDVVPEDLKAAAHAGSAVPVEPLIEVEKAHVLRALREADGNKKRAAEMLGIDRSTLYAKLRRYGDV